MPHFCPSSRGPSPFYKNDHIQLGPGRRWGLMMIAILGLIALIVMLSFSASASGRALAKASIREARAAADAAEAEAIRTARAQAFAGLSLEARHVLVSDLSTGEVWFARDADTSAPLASVAKLATAYLSMQDLAKEPITITEHALASEGSFGLEKGSRVHRDELIRMALVISSNDAAEALADAHESMTGVSMEDSLNTWTHNQGWMSFHFENPTGLDSNDGTPQETAGAWASASDVMSLMERAVRDSSDIFARSAEYGISELAPVLHTKSVNTNTARAHLQNLRLSKTGFTDLAGGNVVFVFEPEIGRPFGVVILGSSYDGRFSDADALVAEISRWL